jgi:hypothetical protein
VEKPMSPDCTDCNIENRELELLTALLGHDGLSVYPINNVSSDRIESARKSISIAALSGISLSPQWSESLEFLIQDDVQVLATPLEGEPLPERRASKASHLHNRSTLLHIDAKDTSFAVVFSVYSSAATYAEAAEDKDWKVDLVFANLQGEVLSQMSTDRVANSLGKSDIGLYGERALMASCTAGSWSQCVEKNIRASGATELLLCLAFGKYCAGGIAVLCAVDVQAGVARAIYCKK